MFLEGTKYQYSLARCRPDTGLVVPTVQLVLYFPQYQGPGYIFFPNHCAKFTPSPEQAGGGSHFKQFPQVSTQAGERVPCPSTAWSGTEQTQRAGVANCLTCPQSQGRQVVAPIINNVPKSQPRLENVFPVLTWTPLTNLHYHSGEKD